MSRFRDRPFYRLALIGAVIGAFALAACGRKGPLDPPPAATSATGKQQPANTDLIRSPFGQQPKATSETAPTAPNKKFILDPLLN